MKCFYSIVLIIICFFYTQGQKLQGTVVDAATREPISGASVYIDGTSKGVITDLDGNFIFNYPEGVSSSLVVRMLGYQSVKFQDPLNANLDLIKLIQNVDELDAAVLELDPWSREKKEQFFKKYFIGNSKFSQDVEILNLDKVRLRFNPSTALLTARCKEPILIRNNYLGYKISYDLLDFELTFNKQNTDSLPDGIRVKNATQKEFFNLREAFYSGSSFFQELPTDKKSVLRRYKRRREELYKVGEMRFYKAIYNRQLKEQGYKLFEKDWKVSVSDHLRIYNFGDLKKVRFRNEKYSLLDDKGNQTELYLNGETILIHKYGINITPKNFKFSGFLAELKVGGMLPLDYRVGAEKK